MRARDLVPGIAIGEWTLLRKVDKRWLCRCSCGAEHLVWTHHLTCDTVRRRSRRCAVCGAKARTKHGMTHSVEHAAWREMRRKCRSPGHRSYHLYGGAGIRICERWESFAAFFADLGHCRWDQTLQRLDVTKDFEPGNALWRVRDCHA